MPDNKTTDRASSGAPKLLSGGNPQIPKGEGDAPVQAYIAAMPGWKRAIGERRTWADVADATRRVYAAVGAYPVPERHAATDGDEEAAGA